MNLVLPMACDRAPSISQRCPFVQYERSPRATARTKSSEDRVFRWFVVLAAVFSFAFALPAGAQEARQITLPVEADDVFGGYGGGGVYWSDTYGACRSGCSRSHQGVDMLGPKGTPLLAAADGYISWMRVSASSGNNLVITDDDGWEYHYIHINNDTPGTDDGANSIEHAFSDRIAEAWENDTWRDMRVTAGELVAYMGDSGNAEACNCSHLHFEIVNPDGVNINPTPSVDAAFGYAEANPQGIVVDADLLGPYEEFAELGSDLFTTLTGRSATSAEILELRATLESDGFAAALAPFVDNNSQSADIDRLYVAYFNRLPDYGGYEFWHGRLNVSDWDIQRASRYFAESPEAVATYGDAELEEFLDILYSEVLGREPDAGGAAYWLDRLENDPLIDKANIVAFFTDSLELREITEHRSEIVALSALFADRMPTEAEIEAWEALRSGASLEDAISGLFDPNS